MKKSLFILLACLISVSMVPLCNADDCDGLEGEALELCESYCYDKNCQEDDQADINGSEQSCKMLKKNYAKHTGVTYFPCDTVACALCGDPSPCVQTSTLGVCEQMLSYECDAIAGALNVGEHDCANVTIPADIAPGCSQIPPQWGLIPDCQYTGPPFVCRLFIGGVLVDKCPAPPTCLTDCSSDDDCLTGFICVDDQCAPDCECVGDECVPN